MDKLLKLIRKDYTDNQNLTSSSTANILIERAKSIDILHN